MEDLTVEQLEELIILAERKMSTMDETDDRYQAESDLVDKLRGIRAEKLYGTTEA
jgi:hypothetical protein